MENVIFHTILLALWPWACQEQIEMYIAGYLSLLPDAQILLLFPNHYFAHVKDEFKQSSEHNKRVQLLDDDSLLDQNATYHLHIFGQQGASQTCSWLRSHNLRYGNTLRIGSTIMEREPKTFGLSFQTIPSSNLLPHQSLSRLWHSLGQKTLSVVLSTVSEYMQTSSSRGGPEQGLHDVRLIPPSAKRCYVLDNIMFYWMDDPDKKTSERFHWSFNRNALGGRRWNSHKEQYWLGIEHVCGPASLF